MRLLILLVPLWLAHENLPPWQVGVVSSSYFAGNWLGTLVAGSLIKHCGFNRSYYLASAIFALGCVGLGVMIGFWSWMLWRFLAGVGYAMIWIIVESALLCNGTSRNRGRLLAAYMMVYYAGTVFGQLLFSKVTTELINVLRWAAGDAGMVDGAFASGAFRSEWLHHLWNYSWIVLWFNAALP